MGSCAYCRREKERLRIGPYAPIINWGVWDVKLKLFGSTRRKSPLLQGLGHDYRYLRYDPTQGAAPPYALPVLTDAHNAVECVGSDVDLNSVLSLT